MQRSGCTRTSPLQLALLSNLTELTYLQGVIGDQLIHRQPTERKVLIQTSTEVPEDEARLEVIGEESKVPYVRVFNSYMNQLIRTLAYVGATCTKE